MLDLLFTIIGYTLLPWIIMFIVPTAIQGRNFGDLKQVELYLIPHPLFMETIFTSVYLMVIFMP